MATTPVNFISGASWNIVNGYFGSSSSYKNTCVWYREREVSGTNSPKQFGAVSVSDTWKCYSRAFYVESPCTVTFLLNLTGTKYSSGVDKIGWKLYYLDGYTYISSSGNSKFYLGQRSYTESYTPSSTTYGLSYNAIANGVDGGNKICEGSLGEYSASSSNISDLEFKVEVPEAAVGKKLILVLHPDKVYNVWVTLASGGSLTVKESTTKTYDIRYDSNGGSDTLNTQSKTYGVNLTLASAISRSNNSSLSDYTVSFNANGGSCSASSLVSDRYYSYSFAGWKSSVDSSVYSGGATYSKNVATTMTAQWDITENTLPITLPTPTRTGYSFKGWYTASSGGTRVGGADSSYTPSGNVTLYAQWDILNYTLTLIPGSYIKSVNGSTSSISMSLPYGSTATVTCEMTSTDGYTTRFLSWSGSGVASSALQTYSFAMPANAVTLTASAEIKINSYALSLTKDDGIESVSSVPTPGSIVFKTPVTATAVLNDPTPQYTYTFDGWYNTDSPSTRRCSELSYTFNMQNANTTLLAKSQSTVNRYSLSAQVSLFDYSGQKSSESPSSFAETSVSPSGVVEYGTSATFTCTFNSTALTKYFVYFLGWYADEDCTIPVKVDSSTTEPYSYTLNKVEDNYDIYAKVSYRLKESPIYIYDNSENTYKKALPYIYTNGSWVEVKSHIYHNGEWCPTISNEE